MMRLTSQQLADYDEFGYLLIPAVFTSDEARLLSDAYRRAAGEDHPANVVEKNTGAVRTAMALHLRDEVFARLVRHPRLLTPARQLTGSDDLYAQQVKVNVKAAHVGEAWQWHYDFATHSREDGVPKPRALNLHVFVDDVTHHNGPLQFAVGSHRVGVHDTFLDTETTSYDLWCVEDDVVAPIVEQHGVFTAIGPAGSLLIFGDTMLHTSPPNCSGDDRRIFSLILNPVDNAATRDARDDWKHHRDHSAIEPLADNCLT
jgi:ectoine hydroxylase